MERVTVGRRIGYLDCLKKQGIVRGFFVCLLLLIEWGLFVLRDVLC